ncbi:hypothetical protein [Vibrio sp. SCSIO 43136]|uniref:hypothetical protein n=1 Tax=Vibrio sp. SCSIO 43136 TaxID=2819101 RepID=UPI0020755904|nr:hypothetical protein [Vibrio sp. SCSIO 43136]USD65783.1 hypothetical protein J4N39_02875 [Vibrio sp. SCSIO 43136]
MDSDDELISSPNRIKLVIGIALMLGLTIMFYWAAREHFLYGLLEKQIGDEFYIIYTDPSYLISVVGVVVCPITSVYFITLLLVPSSSDLAVKTLGAACLLGLVVIIIGQPLERYRQVLMAESNGYLKCPPFTFDTKDLSIVPMVSHEHLCGERELQAKVRYISSKDLDGLNEYIQNELIGDLNH